MTRRRRPQSGASGRDYPRTARVNELLREILAESLEVIDDERIGLLTITGVRVDKDLKHAVVFYDSLEGEEGDEQVLAVLGELRVRLQASIGRQARLRNTPELTFKPDPAVRGGARIEDLLRELDTDDES
jgi:ribosome-binding factor A